MPETHDPSSPTLAATTVLDQSNESHIDLLQRAAIGPISAEYYRPILSRFESYDRGAPSWNWAASLCTLNWMVFRGMWQAALAYLGGLLLALALLFALTRLAAPMAASVEWGLWAALGIMALLVPGFFGNTWLFGHYRLRLTRALSATPTVNDACQLLSRQASTRRRLVVLVAVNALLALSVAAAIFWPNSAWKPSARVDQGTVQQGALPTAPAASEPSDAPAGQSAAQASPPGVATSEPSPTATALPDTTDPVAAAASGPDTANIAPPETPQASGSAPAPAPASASASASVPVPVPVNRPEPTSTTPESATRATPAEPATRAPDATQLPPRTMLASADAAIRHGAIAARSRKAHLERSQPPADTVTATGASAPPPPAPAAAKSAPAATKAPAGRYLINVGLFAQEDNARRAFERLQAAGLPASTELLQRGNTPLTRVRAGPFANRAQADAAAQTIRALQLDAVVIRP